MDVKTQLRKVLFEYGEGYLLQDVFEICENYALEMVNNREEDINKTVYILERIEKRNRVISMGYFDSFDKAKEAQSQSNLKTQINVQKIY